MLIGLLREHCVDLHSLNERTVQIETESGRMQAGIHGVFAQYFREQTTENSEMGSEQAARSGYWINRPPMGYGLIDRVLVPNDVAPIMRRVLKLRADGMSYADIEAATSIKYSTGPPACLNRAHTVVTFYADTWYPGRHQALVSTEDFERIQQRNGSRGRTSNDLLAGRVT